MQKFDKKLSDKILPKFNNAKDWSDLMTIIKNLKENVKKYNNCNMFLISDKNLLSKRLAQSLNPSLPDGLHEITLEVYDMLFENIRVNIFNTGKSE
jgi:ethanolamine utilization protein EutA (predicted chaperonin)